MFCCRLGLSTPTPQVAVEKNDFKIFLNFSNRHTLRFEFCYHFLVGHGVQVDFLRESLIKWISGEFQKHVLLFLQARTASPVLFSAEG